VNSSQRPRDKAQPSSFFVAVSGEVRGKASFDAQFFIDRRTSVMDRQSVPAMRNSAVSVATAPLR
jgi:hypothetical protein